MDGPIFVLPQLLSPVNSPNVRFYAPMLSPEQSLVNMVAMPHLNLGAAMPFFYTRRMSHIPSSQSQLNVQIIAQQRAQEVRANFLPPVTQGNADIKTEKQPPMQQQQNKPGNQRDETKVKDQGSEGTGEQILNIKIFKSAKQEQKQNEPQGNEAGSGKNVNASKQEGAASAKNSSKGASEENAKMLPNESAEANEAGKVNKGSESQSVNPQEKSAAEEKLAPKNDKSELKDVQQKTKDKEASDSQKIGLNPSEKNAKSPSEELSSQNKIPAQDKQNTEQQSSEKKGLFKEQQLISKNPQTEPHTSSFQRKMEVQKQHTTQEAKEPTPINDKQTVQKSAEPIVTKIEKSPEDEKLSKDKNRDSEKKETTKIEKELKASETKYERRVDSESGEKKFMPKEKNEDSTLTLKEQLQVPLKEKHKISHQQGEKQLAASGAIKDREGQKAQQLELRLSRALGQENLALGWAAALTPGKITRDKRGGRQAQKQKMAPLKECKLSDLLYIFLAALASGANSIDEIAYFIEKRAQWFSVVLGLKESSLQSLPSRQMIWWLLLALDSSAFDSIVVPWLEEVRGKNSLITSQVTGKPLLPNITLWETDLGLAFGQVALSNSDNIFSEVEALLCYGLNLRNSVVMAEGFDHTTLSRQIARKRGSSIIAVEESLKSEKDSEQDICFESYLEGEDRVTVYVNPVEEENFTANLNVEYEIFGKGTSYYNYVSQGIKNPADPFFPMFRLKNRIKRPTFWMLNIALDTTSEDFTMANSRKNFELFKSYVHDIVDDYVDGDLTILQKMKKAAKHNEYLYKLLS